MSTPVVRGASNGKVGDSRHRFDDDSLREIACVANSRFADQSSRFQRSTRGGRLAWRAARAAGDEKGFVVTAGKPCARILGLMLGIGLTIGITAVQSQLLTGTPTESASTPKPRTQKRTEATPPVESAVSPLAAESPAASPRPKRIRRNRKVEVSPSPTPTPVASPTPRKFRLRFPRLFKPKTSPSASPSA